jgi:hypothetical protein
LPPPIETILRGRDEMDAATIPLRIA